MVKSDASDDDTDGEEATTAAAAGSRWTTIQRNPALTVYLTLLGGGCCWSDAVDFSRFTAWAMVAKLMAAGAATAAAAAATALLPDSQ